MSILGVKAKILPSQGGTKGRMPGYKRLEGFAREIGEMPAVDKSLAFALLERSVDNSRGPKCLGE